MKRIKAYQYSVEGHKDLAKFAKGILALVNLKSSRKGTVVDIRTFEDCNTIRVVTEVEMDGFITDYLGEITERETIWLLQIEYEDLRESEQNALNQAIDSEWECFITANGSNFI